MPQIKIRNCVLMTMVLGGGILSPGIAQARECNTGRSYVTVTATSLLFTVYTPSTPAPLQSNVSVTAACAGNNRGSPKLPPFTVAISTGFGSYTQRVMTKGSASLNYQIYTGASLTMVWGDGTGNTSTISGGNNGTNSQTIIGYGSIPPGQYVNPGVYTDRIIVTVIY